MKKNISLYILLRDIFYYIFLGIIYFILKEEKVSFLPLFLFLGFSLLDSIYSIIYFKSIGVFFFLKEILIFSFFCVITGGPESPFVPFFFVVVVITSFNLSFGKTFSLTTIISILLTFVIFGKGNFYPESISIVNIQPKSKLDLILNVVIYIFLFYLVSAISTFVSEKLRKEIKRIKIKTDDILNSMKIGIITTDNDYNILTVNKWAKENFYLKQGVSLFDEKIPREIKEVIKDLNEQGKEKEFNLNGRIYSIIFFSIEEGKGKVFIISDITEKKELTNRIILYDRMATIGKFAADIAHEIRNPFMSIRNAILLLQNKKRLKRKEKEKLWNYILIESDRIEKLIKDFLTYSKDTKLDIKEVNLKKLFKDILDSIKFHPSFKKNVKINLECEDIKLNIDPEKMKSVILNLIDNSLKAVGENGKIIIRGYRNENVIIEVEDNGSGIPDELKDKIFQPFFTTRKEGAGFGLAIVKKIVELHNGKVSFSSKKGKTIFRIEL
uniref:histidine kinase n=1 Tax=candidate division WOR-3 bacterium TaxID=2052148 RepID=A0A7C4YBP0_UNCW3